MAAEGALSFSVASVVEDVLQQHGIRSRDLDLESRRAEEAAIRRYEAAGWLRKMVGVVGAKDLPAEPSEEEFRLGLRSGMILCNVLNKIQPGAVPKVVVESPDSALVPDGAALSAYQYFENVRNFLVAVQEMGLPTFEASDLEQGGKSARVVNSVLALKSYSDWKQTGGNGVWKFGGNLKPVTSGKHFVRKNSDPFTGSLSRSLSTNEKSLNSISPDLDPNNKCSYSLSMLVRAVLLDKKPDEIPTLVESVLSKVVEEFENRIACQTELKKTISKDAVVSQGSKSLLKHGSADMMKVEEKKFSRLKKDECFRNAHIPDEESKRQILKQQMIFERQNRELMDLKQTLHTTKAGMQFMQMKFHEDIHNLGVNIHGLAHAASGYHKVLEENRKLYNQVQDLKGSIRVYCRVRPFLGGQSNYLSTVDHIEEGTITITTPSKHGRGCKSFNFNKVFGPSATQAEVFSDTQPLIRSVLDGYNSGPKDLTVQNQGVNYRALGDLFLLAEQRRNTFRYDVSVQMIEIYNEQVRDLLVTDGLNVPDANLVRVLSTSDVIDLMNIGQKNRAVGATALNDRSSRSHSCLTVHVEGRDLMSGTILRGCMHLVDLAGSERVHKSEVTGDRLKEAQHINKSLSALGDVISSLAQKNSHVPYRNSKLTQLLQDSLGGQAKTLMFVHISPGADALGETISTLKFAERVATVELGAARVNKDGADVKELKEQIASLKAALARKERHVEPLQQKISGSPCGIVSSPYHPSPLNRDTLDDQKSRRKPMEDVGNIEVQNNLALRQKRQSFDLDELLGNSPPWPPISSPAENFIEDDKETGSGEWVDKVMVNKQDALRGVHNPLGQWGADNGNMSDVFYEKYLSDSSKMYAETVLDAGTSDSSEPDLLWQFNNARLANFTNNIESNTQKPNPKPAKNPELSRNVTPKLGPSQKLASGVGPTPQRNGRQAIPTEFKRKAGNRK
ncbi:P-loop nucleoside triphosphate hydrolases superfamily protein with CH (Calponin Homology) domain-containing protein [Actinidia rufa]|uniref:P-loop nucleoside triphosphate hydrolases superfamily protein with CH (Calponin Homology) domain-containing protein n=1 Tax=Actinidia rufa TaxID=165716 RepID=A0A7J0H9D3_9ERIC|nr:P-loop nucleoside triphosphate hydrolases superfamily protein with CH (Calponin Homology) domain-containing protein [Actinidia rufa]